jgi:plastocyanin
MKKRFVSVVMLAVVVVWASPVLAGSLSGTIKLGIAAPSMSPMKIDKDQEVCGKERASEKLTLSGDNGIANAMITIKGVTGGKKLDTAKKIEFVQEKCQFKPHVLVIPKGATIDVVNNDPITHNIHTFARKNQSINKAQPSSLKRFTSPQFTDVEQIKVQCDIHRGLMSAWFFVVDSPYTVVTDASGKFNITDVPPGTYEVEIWHEALGKQMEKVTIAAGDAKLDVSLMPQGKK